MLSCIGCVQPGAVDADLTAQVKAAVLSPEITSALSSHIEQIADKAVNKAVSQQGLVNIEKVQATVKAEVKAGVANSEQSGNNNSIGNPWPAVIAAGFGFIAVVALVYLVLQQRNWRDDERKKDAAKAFREQVYQDSPPLPPGSDELIGRKRT